jgi:phospholipid N-methyltransferase
MKDKQIIFFKLKFVGNMTVGSLLDTSSLLTEHWTQVNTKLFRTS